MKCYPLAYEPIQLLDGREILKMKCYMNNNYFPTR